ncbi:ATP-binding protein [Wenxinia marina]|uniref:AAA domain protein n=1 Tax=Wenxinia marina DSM 24838 TaxID=1123501 RepID=A0A0D0QJN9_9RHOB|nr:ATP-binding protein [Wenxinia marina]KIQ71203.1 AAA domain protein [Wenxinia marina DSM 24838]GGL81665.1 hypothetical protein GCM10011392_40340 [Wenxinia marina]
MSFVIDEIVSSRQSLSWRTFPLRRAEELKANIARIFSQHLGDLKQDIGFESQCLVVTGEPGSGKTKEVKHQIAQFNDGRIPLPDGKPSRMVSCLLDAKGGWKDLGSTTLRSLGYPIENLSRHTQASITAKIVDHAKRCGVVGMYFDEAQHILRSKNETNRHVILDSFKTLMKSQDWPLMLILTGVPELMGYVQEEPQLHRLVTHQTFPDLELPADLGVINDIVQSAAIESQIEVSDDVMTRDVYIRLATAGAFGWGLVIGLVIDACEAARVREAGVLERRDFAAAWCGKVASSRGLNPFTHDAYDKVLRREHPFRMFSPA